MAFVDWDAPGEPSTQSRDAGLPSEWPAEWVAIWPKYERMGWSFADYERLRAEGPKGGVDATWDNGGGTGVWNTGTNWTGDAVPDGTATFNTTSTANCAIDVAVNITSIVIASGYTGVLSHNATFSVTTSGAFSIAAGTHTTNNEAMTVGSWSQSGGTVNLGSSTATCNGSYTHSAGTFNEGTSVWVVGGSGTYSGAGLTVRANTTAAEFASLTVNASMTMTCSANFAVCYGTLTLNGTISIDSGIAADFKPSGANGLVVGGAGTISGAGRAQVGSDVSFNLPAASMSIATLFLCSLANGSITITLTGNLAASGSEAAGLGALRVAQFDGGDTNFVTVDCNGFALTVANGRLQVGQAAAAVTGVLKFGSGAHSIKNFECGNDSGVVYCDMGSGSISVSGNWNEQATSGSWAVGTSTVTLTGASPTLQQDSASNHIYNLRWNGTGTFAPGTGNFRCSNQMRFSAATCAPTLAPTAGADVLVDGATVTPGTLTWTCVGFSASSGTWSATGGTAYTLTNTGTFGVSGATFHGPTGVKTLASGVSTLSSGTVNINGTTTLTGAVTASGATVAVAANTWTCSSTLTMNNASAAITVTTGTVSMVGYSQSQGVFASAGGSAYTFTNTGTFAVSGGTFHGPTGSKTIDGAATISGAGTTVNINGTTTFSGQVTVSALVAVAANSWTCSSASTFTCSDGGSVTVSTGTISITAAISVTGGTLGSADVAYTLTANSTLSASSTGTFNSPNASGAWTQTGAVTFAATVNLYRDFSLPATGTISGGTTTVSAGTLTISGAATLSGGTIAVGANALTFSAAVTCSSAVSATTGTITVSAALVIDATFGSSAAYTLDANANLTINASKTLSAPNGSGTFNFSGATFEMDGTYTANSGTLNFDRATAQTFNGGAQTYSAISMSNDAATITAGEAYTASGTTTIAANRTWAVSSGITGTHSGALTVNGTLTASGTVDINAAYTQAADLTVPAGGEVDASGATSVTLTSTIDLTVTGTLRLKVTTLYYSGVLTNNGTITGTVTFSDVSPGVTGNFIEQVYQAGDTATNFKRLIRDNALGSPRNFEKSVGTGSVSNSEKSVATSAPANFQKQVDLSSASGATVNDITINAGGTLAVT